MAHNSFEFIRNRYKAITPTEIDFNEFNLYMCNMLTSMSRQPQLHSKLIQSNTIAFSRLTSRQQCMAFTSLDGTYIDTTWHLPNRDVKQEFNDYLNKIMYVLDCSRSQAQSMVSNGKLDKEKIEICYNTLTEQKIKRGKK